MSQQLQSHIRNKNSNATAIAQTYRCFLPLALHDKLQAAALFEEQEPQKQQQRTLHVSNTHTHIDVGLIEVEAGQKTQRENALVKGKEEEAEEEEKVEEEKLSRILQAEIRRTDVLTSIFVVLDVTPKKKWTKL